MRHVSEEVKLPQSTVDATTYRRKRLDIADVVSSKAAGPMLVIPQMKRDLFFLDDSSSQYGLIF